MSDALGDRPPSPEPTTRDAQASPTELAGEHEELIRLANQTMPFGKYEGRLLLDLPEPYLVWFKNEGWPRGKLGQRMALMYEVKLNGLEKLLRPLVDSTNAE